MSYAQGEADLLELIQTLDDWTTDNSISVANDTDKRSSALINSGKDYKYLFLSPGAFQSAFASINDSIVITGWQTVITIAVYERIPGPSPETDLVALRQTVVDLLDSYFQGDSASTISIVKVLGGEEIDTWKSRTSGKVFHAATLTAAWEEVREVTQND